MRSAKDYQLDERDPIDAAILAVSDRFPEWLPTPAMVGFARAVGKVVIDEAVTRAARVWHHGQGPVSMAIRGDGMAQKGQES